MDEKMRSDVFESLDNAIENGFPVDLWPTNQVATDMCDCDATFEGHDPWELVKYIEAWKFRRAAKAVDASTRKA